MDSKFGHLLQPIRDLAKNWDVDVAQDLEDYLDELESIHFEFENEGETGGLKFAEAALVIQGSTNVYSKKVEHLHNLVRVAMDAIVNRRLQRKEVADAQESDEGSDMETEEQFLTLDDIPPGGDDIDMAEQADSNPPPTTARPPTCLYMLGNCEGPMSLSRHQMYADRSGAVLLDPSDTLEPCTTTMYRQSYADGQATHGYDGSNAAYADAHGASVDAEPVSTLPLQSDPDELFGAEDQEDWEDDIDDPYEPLDSHAPGPLADKPFKLRIPTKKTVVKANCTTERLPLLIRVGNPNSMALEEFEIYNQRRREISRQQRQSTDHNALSTPKRLGNQDTFEDGNDPGFEDDGEEYDHYDADDGGVEQQPFSPIIGAPDLEVDSAQLDAVTSYQDTSMYAWNAQLEAAAGDLQDRVKRWQESIQPHLEAQDQRTSFDISVYKDNILKKLKAKEGPGQVADFGIVACHKEAWEVPRIFASMLQLVNAGSVLIYKS